MSKKKELTGVSEKLDELGHLQAIHSKIDEIQILKGELPIEVADLEDEIAGMEKRLHKIEDEIKEAEEEVATRKANIKEATALITKYEKQLHNVKNNREYDALNKEIELQKLDIQLSEKKIKEGGFTVENLQTLLEETGKKIDVKKKDLVAKKKELNQIIADTEKEEKELQAKADGVAQNIEERLLTAYNRIRTSYKNGLAVVQVKRNSCGGCFGYIPPQTQSEIRSKKRIMTCEHCGRIFFDVEDNVVLSEEEIA